MTECPNVAAVSARTLYPGRSLMERVFGFLGWSYLFSGSRGTSRYISGNAACFRHEAYRHHPLPEGLDAFASRIQSEAFWGNGATLLFDPDLLVVNDFEGWPIERDIRRNHNYNTVVPRLRHDRLQYARLVRAGVLAIPLIVAGKNFDSVRDCFRHYNVKTYLLPLALTLTVITHLLEIIGMLAVYRGQTLGEVAFP